MSDNNSNQNANKYLFINLVTMLGLMAMQQLGKVINPLTGKTAISLDAAQATIDTLDMLSAKTGGKLDNDEKRLLKDTLAALKMNYVETEERQKAEGGRQKAEGGGQKAEDSGQSPESKPQGEDKQAGGPEESKQTGDDKAKTKDPKFHKSYE